MRTQSTTDLDIVQAEYDAGNIPWSDVQATQNALLPRCPTHNRPASASFAGKPVCAVCIKVKARAALIVAASREPRA